MPLDITPHAGLASLIADTSSGQSAAAATQKIVAEMEDVFYYHMGDKAPGRPENTLEQSLKYTGEQPYDGAQTHEYQGPASFSAAYDAHDAHAWAIGENEGAVNSVHYLGRYL